MPKDLDQLAALAPEYVEVAAVRVAPKASCTSKASEFMPRRISVWPVAIHTRTAGEMGSPRPSICQCRDRNLQRRRVDRARDPHPSPGRKLDLDRAAAGRPDRTKRRPRLRDHHRRYEARLMGDILRFGAKRPSPSEQQ